MDYAKFVSIIAARLHMTVSAVEEVYGDTVREFHAMGDSVDEALASLKAEDEEDEFQMKRLKSTKKPSIKDELEEFHALRKKKR